MSAPALPPGPRTPGPLQAVGWGLRYPQFTQRGRRRFGSTFTIRPGTMAPIVLTSDGDAIRRLFTGDPLGKRHANDAVRPLLGDRSVLLLDPAEHLQRRKLLLPPFHGERVRGYAELMRKLMEAEVGRWRPGDSVAMLPLAQNVTIEVILQAVLGVADQPTRDRFRRLIDNVLFYPFGAAGIGLSRLHPALAFVTTLFTPAVMTYFPGMKRRAWWNVGTRVWWKHYDRLMAELDRHTDATRADPRLADREDILAMLVTARDEDGNGLSTQDLREDVLTLIGAGHETTAAAIAWGSVLLAHHAGVRRRAADATRNGDEEYLVALVKEVLRLRPPIPVAAGRVIDEPFPIGPHTVPAGTMVLIDAWGVHHDPERYPDPERFDPERFLGESAGGYNWLPFGGGAHRCIGSALAELEIRIALTTILRRVEIGPADAELVPPARRGLVVVPYAGGRIAVI